MRNNFMKRFHETFHEISLRIVQVASVRVALRLAWRGRRTHRAGQLRPRRPALVPRGLRRRLAPLAPARLLQVLLLFLLTPLLTPPLLQWALGSLTTRTDLSLRLVHTRILVCCSSASIYSFLLYCTLFLHFFCTYMYAVLIVRATGSRTGRACTRSAVAPNRRPGRAVRPRRPAPTEANSDAPADTFASPLDSTRPTCVSRSTIQHEHTSSVDIYP